MSVVRNRRQCVAGLVLVIVTLAARVCGKVCHSVGKRNCGWPTWREKRLKSSYTILVCSSSLSPGAAQLLTWTVKVYFLQRLLNCALEVLSLEVSGWRMDCSGINSTDENENPEMQVLTFWLNVNGAHTPLTTQALVRRVPGPDVWQPLMEHWPGNCWSVTALSGHEWVYSVSQLLAGSAWSFKS